MTTEKLEKVGTGGNIITLDRDVIVEKKSVLREDGDKLE